MGNAPKARRCAMGRASGSMWSWKRGRGSITKSEAQANEDLSFAAKLCFKISAYNLDF